MVKEIERASISMVKEIEQASISMVKENRQTKRLFQWTICNFSSLNRSEKHYSDVFTADGYEWRLLMIFPKGKCSGIQHLSLYLEVADSSTLRNGWIRYTDFSLAVVNQLHNKKNNKRVGKVTHQFTAQESIRGFTHLMTLSELNAPSSRGFLINDTLLVEADVAVRGVVDYWTYDSKKETGYVGLDNQGKFWTMNGVLQILYHIPYLRKALYDMPTTVNDNPSISIPLALQSLFYMLQYSDNSVATKRLFDIFHSDKYKTMKYYTEARIFNWFLFKMLEAKMKGTIQWLFEGQLENYDRTNAAEEWKENVSFYDIVLDVKGCRNVYASFDKYVKVHRREDDEGDDEFCSEEHGSQEAVLGSIFIKFPPVLQLQLNRFIWTSGGTKKINDRYEFPLVLDFDGEDKKYFLPGANSDRNLYTLHSVLMHSGRWPFLKYHTFIRPTLSDQWFKFDEKWVTKEDMNGGLEELYGGEEKATHAYKLIYIRESDREKILCNIDEKDIGEHLRLKNEQEVKEHKKKEKEEAHLCTIKVARNEDLLDPIGKEIDFNLVHDKVSGLRVEKQMPFHVFKKGVAEKFGVPVEYQRFWLWAKRPNHTYRPQRPLTDLEETEPVEKLMKMSDEAHNEELKLFLEVEFGPDSRPIASPKKTQDDILIFFKCCDYVKRELRFVGWLFVKGNGEPAEILTRINKLAGFSPNEEIELYEEINFKPSVMCRHIDKKQTFQANKLRDGDIICFQKSKQDRCCTVPSFLESILRFKEIPFGVSGHSPTNPLPGQQDPIRSRTPHGKKVCKSWIEPRASSCLFQHFGASTTTQFPSKESTQFPSKVIPGASTTTQFPSKVIPAKARRDMRNRNKLLR